MKKAALKKSGTADVGKSERLSTENHFIGVLVTFSCAIDEPFDFVV